MSLMFHQDNELLELRETIDAMKVRNEEAQAVIHGALNNQENTKGSDLLPIRAIYIYIYIYSLSFSSMT